MATLPADSLANDTSPYVPPCGWGALGFPTLAQIHEKLAAKPLDDKSKNLATVRFSMMPIQAIVMQIQKDSEKVTKWTNALSNIDCTTGADLKLLRENPAVWASVLLEVPLLKAKLELLVDQPHLLLRKGLGEEGADHTQMVKKKKDLNVKFLTKRGTLVVVHAAPESVSTLFASGIHGGSSIDDEGEVGVEWEITIGATRFVFSSSPVRSNRDNNTGGSSSMTEELSSQSWFHLAVMPAVIFDPANAPPQAEARGNFKEADRNGQEGQPEVIVQDEIDFEGGEEGKDLLLARMENVALAEALAGFADLVPSFPPEGGFRQVLAAVLKKFV